MSPSFTTNKTMPESDETVITMSTTRELINRCTQLANDSPANNTTLEVRIGTIVMHTYTFSRY